MYSQESMLFLKSEDLRAMLDVDDGTIANLSESKVLLAMNLAGGELAFPEFQFKEGTFNPELIVSFQKFSANTSGWEIAIWFNSWNDNLRDFPVKLIGSREGISSIRMAIDVETSLLSL